MANRDTDINPPNEGETRFGGSMAPGVQGMLYQVSNGVPGAGTVYVFDSIANTGVMASWYLFVGSDGKLRISSTAPSNTNTDGTVVGTQT